ncbi:MAG TPA: tripartite tricarboxylate transporter substrate-binding protein [Xanthobacteraceae bacterium]|nr:tripartite tricarboxylate transporter substrate-binding protein [Xanthobacteraceae bacterium]
MTTRRELLTAFAAAALMNAGGPVTRSRAQAGSGIARILVGFPPGGTSDIIARLLAGTMSGYASAIVVENRPGAGGRVAIESLKSAARDGSIFLITPLATITLYPHVYKALSYDSLKDFTPVTSVAAAPSLLTIGPKVPASVKTLADFVAWCRANPTQANYGSPGAGTSPHFIGVQFGRAAGFEYIHVPYQGNAPAAQDVLGGQIASSVLTIDSTLPYVLAGKLRALATTGPQRSTFLPDVPTFIESGYPGIQLIDMWTVFLPANTPEDRVGKLNASIQKALQSDEMKAGLARLSIEVSAVSRADFAKLVKSDFERWGAIVQASGFTPQD